MASAVAILPCAEIGARFRSRLSAGNRTAGRMCRNPDTPFSEFHDSCSVERAALDIAIIGGHDSPRGILVWMTADTKSPPQQSCSHRKCRGGFLEFAILVAVR